MPNLRLGDPLIHDLKVNTCFLTIKNYSVLRQLFDRIFPLRLRELLAIPVSALQFTDNQIE